MGKGVKFSPLKARMLLMLPPMIGVIILSFSLIFYIVLFLYSGSSFWVNLTIRDYIGLLYVVGFLHIVVPISFIYQMVKDNLLINSNIEELRYCYPELEQDWEDFNYADYLDDQLQVLIYGDHLICYRTFNIVYLPECRGISAFLESEYHGGRHSNDDLINFWVFHVDGSSSKFRTRETHLFGGNSMDDHKKALFDYINENYYYIDASLIGD